MRWSTSTYLSAGCVLAAVSGTMAEEKSLRSIMYLTGQHATLPATDELRHVTHVNLAFLNSPLFNEDPPETYPLFAKISDLRPQFPSNTKFIVSIGGWGDTSGFDVGAGNATTQKIWAENVATMIERTGADGVDIDWEYPGGNGEDYKINPNSNKTWEIWAYPSLLTSIRNAIGPDVLLTAAVPGRAEDLIAFTNNTMPSIMESLDYLNVMTYDLMNRRDTVIKHHTGIQESIDALELYVSTGAPLEKLNLGLAWYVKWFHTNGTKCDLVTKPIGCPTGIMEDPHTGADLGKAGAFSWDDQCPEDLEASFQRSLTKGNFTEVGGGGYGYFDESEDIWWTYDTPEVLALKFQRIVDQYPIGGVFAWGLGEDGPDFKNLGELNKQLDERTSMGNHDELWDGN